MGWRNVGDTVCHDDHTFVTTRRWRGKIAGPEIPDGSFSYRVPSDRPPPYFTDPDLSGNWNTPIASHTYPVEWEATPVEAFAVITVPLGDVPVLADALERACMDFETGRDAEGDYERCAALREAILGQLRRAGHLADGA